MGIVDTVKIVKKTQEKDVVMIKIGKFIYSYGKDAYILSYIFGYKLTQMKDTIYVCGFPRNKLNYIMATLENKKINYLILDRRNSYRVDEECNNKNLNQYDEFLEKALKYIKRKRKVDYIYTCLLKDIEKDEIDDLIFVLKKEIDERRKI